jgi:hypothetical protein
MQSDVVLRQQLVKLLTSGEAHADFDTAVKGLPTELRGQVSKGGEHSPWQLLEHMRIALWDILEFSLDVKHKSPKWPDDYWPKKSEPASASEWDESVKEYKKLIQGMSELVSDESVDLFAKIPHGDGQTVLREALLVADHNAYHIGQLVLTRKLLGAWG